MGRAARLDVVAGLAPAAQKAQDDGGDDGREREGRDEDGGDARAEGEAAPREDDGAGVAGAVLRAISWYRSCGPAGDHGGVRGVDRARHRLLVSSRVSLVREAARSPFVRAACRPRVADA
jgi:hypothetical protein